MHKKDKGGFTLIEVLVVITILAILAAILFPTFSQARRQSLGATCTSNLKQIGLAIAMYKADWDGYFPNGSDGRSQWRGPTYMSQLDSYVQSAGIYHCPLDRGFGMDEMFYGVDDRLTGTAFDSFGTSYSYQLTGLFPRVLSESEVTSPAEQAVVWDFSGAWHSGEPLVPLTATLDEWQSRTEHYRYFTLFFDVHVKNINRKQWLAART